MGFLDVWHIGGRSKPHSFQSRVRLRGGMSHTHSCEESCFFSPALQTSAEGSFVRLRKGFGVMFVYIVMRDMNLYGSVPVCGRLQ